MSGTIFINDPEDIVICRVFSPQGALLPLINHIAILFQNQIAKWGIQYFREIITKHLGKTFIGESYRFRLNNKYCFIGVFDQQAVFFF